MPQLLFLDFETFSEADLKKVGAYAYAEHDSTEILLASYAFDDGPAKVWDATCASGESDIDLDNNSAPDDLLRGLRRAKRGRVKLVMHNGLMFDRLIIRECLGLDIPPEHIHDTMVQAFRHALPGSLDKLCEVLNVDADLAKDKAGKALIKRFCKPTPKNYKIRRYDRNTHPDEWKQFKHYARNDITAMREIYYKMPSWGEIDKENEILALDQRINDRGFYVDTDLAKAATAAVAAARAELQEAAQATYGGGLTGADFLPLLRDLAPAHHIPNAQKSTLGDLLDDADLPDEARQVIEMRLGAASTASTKYAPLLNGMSADGRRRGCLQYGGAKRTLRWAGKGFQPQNLARGYFKEKPLARGIEALKRGTAEYAFDVMKLAASTVRGCIIPAPGKKLVVADYSNVEGRGLAWLAGEDSALDTFRAGLDIYKVTAGKMFGISPDDVDGYRRQIGKACELGLGYGGGVAAFLTFSKNLGLDLEEMAVTMAGTFPDYHWRAALRAYEFMKLQEVKRKPLPGKKDDRTTVVLSKKAWLTCDCIKRMWRESHPRTVQFWYDLEEACLMAIDNPGASYWAGAKVRQDGKRAIRIERTLTRSGKPGNWLKIELPSGRILSYPGIGVSMEKTNEDDPGEKARPRIKYRGENQLTRQWGWQHTYGGKLAENVTQALCRDILAWCMLPVDNAGYEIILSVHDELITETPDTAEYNVAELERLMCDLPAWAKGFPLKAEGWEGYRYKK
ncbi:DNA polymerase I [Edwardsiella phage eiAU-183]|uniref:DNA polymerase I n=4 Tax=Viruses TaxID=10239 RepID=E7EKU2_9CAUD|nr:DNA polymerase [Edwardsiella phage eiAU-183]YP_009613873.1 DNA polymerase [Edwardsiella phage eiAU]ADV36499.1 DNA polymerase I [Edwardsiella phage eiDWF]ADV36551.1 DNA polymerase I [Edwardsiella phage eiMSLS]ADV36447.1 DNA polymerase I [Edwardsiella phage eiAU]AHG23439.1 DNA polymerase I [Edwardsiella phage eiAU]AHG23493.1 DNA polymerase I [Edwardsiella phage eiAU-183]